MMDGVLLLSWCRCHQASLRMSFRISLALLVRLCLGPRARLPLAVGLTPLSCVGPVGGSLARLANLKSVLCFEVQLQTSVVLKGA
jgi:hypothetical protein